MDRPPRYTLKSWKTPPFIPSKSLFLETHIKEDRGLASEILQPKKTKINKVFQGAVVVFPLGQPPGPKGEEKNPAHRLTPPLEDLKRRLQGKKGSLLSSRSIGTALGFGPSAFQARERILETRIMPPVL